MKEISAIVLLLLVASGSMAVAADTKSLIGVIPGERTPFAIKPFTPVSPFGIFRLPTPTGRLAQVFPDLEFMVLSKSGRVAGAGAKRAYPDKRKCEEAQQIVRPLLAEVFGAKYSGPDPRWQYQSRDGEITAGVYCSSSSGTPFPVLEMDITHTRTNNEMLEGFKRIPPE